MLLPLAEIYLVSLSPPEHTYCPRRVLFLSTACCSHSLAPIGYQLAHIFLSLFLVSSLQLFIPERNEPKKSTIQNIFFHLSNTCHWHHHTVSGERARASKQKNGRWILLIPQKFCVSARLIPFFDMNSTVPTNKKRFWRRTITRVMTKIH